MLFRSAKSEKYKYKVYNTIIKLIKSDCYEDICLANCLCSYTYLNSLTGKEKYNLLSEINKKFNIYSNLHSFEQRLVYSEEKYKEFYKIKDKFKIMLY